MTAADTMLLAVRLLLAAVFGFAGVAKLADRDGSRQPLMDFGLTGRLARPGAVILPLLELAVAVAVVPATLAAWGAAGAAVLTAIFTVTVVVNLARGRTPECHCFGQLHSKPIGAGTVVRNVVLAATALVVLLNPGPPLGAATNGLSAGQVGGVTVLLLVGFLGAIQTWLLLNVMRQNGRLLLRLDAVETSLRANGLLASQEPGRAVGTEAPEFALPDLSGQTVTLRTLTARGLPVILIFTDPECVSCGALLPDIARWQKDDALTVAVISRGDKETNRVEARKHRLQHVLLQNDWQLSEAYHALATPSAVLIDPAGRVASTSVAGADAIRQLVSKSRRGLPLPSGHAHPNGHRHPNSHDRTSAALPIGQQAPDLSLPDLDGKTVTLADLLGRETLLLFWNPQCGFCQQMLPDLKAWEGRRLRVNVLVISSGSVESNRTMGLSSPVVLDDSGEAMQAFGADGTPMAIVIDGDGRVASDLAVGAAAVLALARGRNIPVHQVRHERHPG